MIIDDFSLCQLPTAAMFWIVITMETAMAFWRNLPALTYLINAQDGANEASSI